jgi:hypothetical protein
LRIAVGGLILKVGRAIGQATLTQSRKSATYQFRHSAGGKKGCQGPFITDSGKYTLQFTAYIDAIREGPPGTNTLPETRPPIGSSYHCNQYQMEDLFLRGDKTMKNGVEYGDNEDRSNLVAGLILPGAAHLNLPNPNIVQTYLLTRLRSKLPDK